MHTIYFSNGLLDPWSAGGVKISLAETLVAIVIPEGAHHLDLRASNPADPHSVIVARHEEKQLVRHWIQQHDQVSSSVILFYCYIYIYIYTYIYIYIYYIYIYIYIYVVSLSEWIYYV